MLGSIKMLIPVDPDSALNLTRAAYELSQKVGYAEGLADASWLLGTREMHLAQYKKAMSYYEQSIEHYKKLKLEAKLADVYVLAGINEGMQQHSAGALGWFLRAISIYEKLHDDFHIADVNYKIGMVYGQVDDYKNAILYSERSLAYATRIGNEDMEVTVWNNLGVLYGQMGAYDKALSVLQQARSHISDSTWLPPLPDVFLNLGIAYKELGQYDKALLYLDSALIGHTVNRFPVRIAGAAQMIAGVYVKMKRYDLAYSYLQRSLGIAKDLDDVDLNYDNSVLLHQILTAQGKYKEAAVVFDDVMDYHSKLKGVDERAHVERTRMAVEMQKVQDEVDALSRMSRERTRQRNLFVGFSSVSLLLAGFAVSTVVQKRKKHRELLEKHEELEEANRTKDRMFAVISHDLRSPLNSIIGSIELFESEVLNEEERRMMLNNLHLSASATLETLDNLLHWGSAQIKNSETRSEAVDISVLADQTRKLLNNVAAHKSVTLTQKIDDVCIARFDRAQLAFIMRNLVVNAIKFSHEGQQVEVSGRKENDRIILQVRDEGIGMSPDLVEGLFDPAKRVSHKGTYGERGVGLGLVLINEFLQKNNGRISVSSKEGSGSCFEVDIPAV